MAVDQGPGDPVELADDVLGPDLDHGGRREALLSTVTWVETSCATVAPPALR